MKTKYLLGVACGTVIALGVGVSFIWQSAEPDRTVSLDETAAMVDVKLPATLSADAEIGRRGFDAKCAACHGARAAGTEGTAPPLVHKIYEPSHHGDESFQIAVARGVRAHHWPFGDMAPVDGLTRADVTAITTYIRELQRANGIE